MDLNLYLHNKYEREKYIDKMNILEREEIPRAESKRYSLIMIKDVIKR